MTVDVGSPAPDFTLPNQHGEPISLSQYAGSQSVAVVFYPFAFSNVCTGELTEIRDRIEEVESLGATVLAVSCDPMFALRVFADRDGLRFPLLSDFWPHGAVASAYGVLNTERGCSARSTFVVDRSGVVRWVVHNEMTQARDFDALRAALAGCRLSAGHEAD